MDLTASTDRQTATLRLQGRFDFSSHRVFREACKAALADGGIRELVIDLSGVDYIDSSALGMLLLTLQNAQQASKALTLSGPTGTVRDVLQIANFQRLFNIK